MRNVSRSASAAVRHEPLGHRERGRSRVSRAVLIVVLLLVLGILASSWPRSQHLTVHLDHVDGLQAGDAVYLNGLRIGRVRDLRLSGRRVAIEIEIEAEHRHAVSAGSRFFLWQDELDPHRRALRVQPSPP